LGKHPVSKREEIDKKGDNRMQLKTEVIENIGTINTLNFLLSKIIGLIELQRLRLFLWEHRN